MDYKELLIKAEKIVIETSHYIKQESLKFDTNNVEVKGLHDFVSYVDKNSEKRLVAQLKNLFPEAGFITEEGTATEKSDDYNWVIDPLDGTTNFIHGLKPFAISVALVFHDEPVIGIVDDVSSDEIFTALQDGGAWLNNKRIQVSKADKLSDSLIGTGLPYYDFDRLNDYMRCLSFLCENTHGVRRIGTAAIDLAYVACGRFDAFFEYGLKPWDITAGKLLVKESGGLVSDFSGEPTISGYETLAANNKVYKEFSKVINEFMIKKTR